MISLISVFITLQVILLFFMAPHDWIHIPPFTDIRELEKYSSKTGRFVNSAIFAALIVLPLSLTYWYRPVYPLGALVTLCALYGLLTVGTVLTWWVPYFFGSSEKHKANFAEYRNTHHFLPSRSNNVIPNTMHVVLHILIWSCFAITIYLLMIW